MEYETRIKTTIIARDVDVETGELVTEREPNSGDWHKLGLSDTKSGNLVPYELHHKALRDRDDARGEVHDLREELAQLKASMKGVCRERDAALEKVKKLEAADLDRLHVGEDPVVDWKASAMRLGGEVAALCSEARGLKADLASAHTTIKGLRRTIEHANETAAWPKPSPLPDGNPYTWTIEDGSMLFNGPGLRGGWKLSREYQANRFTMCVSDMLFSAYLAGQQRVEKAAKPSPLPDGVPGEVWLVRQRDGDGKWSYSQTWFTTPHGDLLREHYSSDAVRDAYAAAKVAEEREAVLQLLHRAHDEGWNYHTVVERIRKRSKP